MQPHLITLKQENAGTERTAALVNQLFTKFRTYSQRWQHRSRRAGRGHLEAGHLRSFRHGIAVSTWGPHYLTPWKEQDSPAQSVLLTKPPGTALPSYSTHSSSTHCFSNTNQNIPNCASLWEHSSRLSIHMAPFLPSGLCLNVAVSVRTP